MFVIIKLNKTESASKRKEKKIVWSEETNHPNLHIPMPYTYRFFFIHDFSILSVLDEGYTRKASYSLNLI